MQNAESMSDALRHNIYNILKILVTFIIAQYSRIASLYFKFVGFADTDDPELRIPN